MAEGKWTLKKGERKMVVWLSILVAVIGLIVYILADNAKYAELGRIAFFVGLLVFLLQADQVVSLLAK